MSDDEKKDLLLRYSLFIEGQVGYKLYGLSNNWIGHINDFIDKLKQ